MMRSLILVFGASISLFGFDRDFDSLVHNMESEYGSKRTYIPFLGFANFIVKIARPAGASDFKLAVFEHVDATRHPSPERLDSNFIPQGWRPFIRVLSNKTGERVQIYARQSHRDHELLVTTFEHDEAVMIRMRVNAEQMAKWVNNPVMMGRSKRHRDID